MKRKLFLTVILFFTAIVSLLCAADTDTNSNSKLGTEADAANKRMAQQAMANPDYRVLPGDK